MNSAPDLKKLATLLSCPEGDEGAKLGERMDQDNFSMTQKAFETLDLAPGSKLIELGHGQAGHLKKLLPAQVLYTGLEVSRLMCENAREKNKNLVEQGRAEFHLFDGSTLDFEEGSFEACVAVNTLYFWPDLNLMFRSIKRVLSANGQLVLSFGDKDFMRELPFTEYGFHFYSCEEVEQALKRAGFKAVDFDKSQERVISKTGDEVERVFWTVRARFLHDTPIVS